MSNDTIAAIATAAGKSGIAVVRISGTNAYEVAAKVFVPRDTTKSLKTAKGYTALFGDFIADDKKADEAVALCFKAPKSYTGEDVVEISVHGGKAITESLLKVCYNSGAVPAAAGEFTRRALINGRLSLTQAEAVMDMINATTKQGAAAASAAMGGALFKQITKAREELLVIAGHITAFTDYPEEDVEELSVENITDKLDIAQKIIKPLVTGYEKGSIIRRGVKTAIVGSPNVGKSTLLNLLAGYDKAIVTEIAGTTRDVVEQEINFAGTTLILADTAGIRETEDIVEAEGIRRSNKCFEESDMVIAVFDGSQQLSQKDKEIAERCRDKSAIAVINKADLDQKIDFSRYNVCFKKIINISAQSEEFTEELEDAIKEIVFIGDIDTDAAILANERQLSAAKSALEAIEQGKEAAAEGFAIDAVSVCIDDAVAALYELTGENASQAVIDEVFTKFCVGK